MLTRRGFLKVLFGGFAGATAFGSYAFGIEPMRLRVQEYVLNELPHWTQGLSLRAALIADPHACRPWMSADRIAAIVQRVNALRPDIVLMLGDYVAGHRFVTDWVHSRDWAAAFAQLNAPLGVHAILGNHDWWEDRTAQKDGSGPTFGRRALEKVGIKVYENDVLRLEKDGQAFWLAGLADQLALLPGHGGRKGWHGLDDLPGTLAKITDDAPVILMAHEPDIFPKVPARVSLTLSGHTHGGQVRLFGYSPLVPSQFGNRYAYGHIIEAGRHLLVSGGLGCSIMPVRLGMPPEITLLKIGGGDRAAGTFS